MNENREKQRRTSNLNILFTKHVFIEDVCFTKLYRHKEVQSSQIKTMKKDKKEKDPFHQIYLRESRHKPISPTHFTNPFHQKISNLVPQRSSAQTNFTKSM
eukprot:TRINITY_DN14083_c0_g2_i1.p2 TRINITY_DN14083_c0_g2~~TRINITY_DN14083_c0_g2_i1.p2  ORF type:complete len:101 (+),score=8.34 TRINITY_DN14083_c0_g2_i1:509-811(+)